MKVSGKTYYFHLLKLEIYALLNHITTSWHILTAPYGNNIHFQVLHHMLSLISVVFAMYSGEGQLYTYMCLISETTTPGINLRWYLMKWMCTVFLIILLLQCIWPVLSPRFLDTAGMKKSKAYLVNGVTMFVAWLVCYYNVISCCKLWRTHYLLFVIEYSNML